MMEEKRISDDLLVKYLAGEASDAEKQAVQQWLQASAEHKNYFAHFRLIWNESNPATAESNVDTDAAWMQFRQRTQQMPITAGGPSRFRWVKIAAALLLLAGGSWLAYFIAGYNKPQAVVVAHDATPNPVNVPLPANNTAVDPVTVDDNAQKTKAITNTEYEVAEKTVKHHRIVVLKPRTKFIRQNFEEGLFKYDRTKDFICNSTPCPIEICIIQTVKCANGEPTAVSTCSVLEPDESGQLRYKAFDKITRNCQATIDEIRIKRVNTGETIVLNADSKPATAQEFFSYITGQKKGDITAGIFHTDCNNNKDDCGLMFDNSNLILQ